MQQHMQQQHMGYPPAMQQQPVLQQHGGWGAAPVTPGHGMPMMMMGNASLPGHPHQHPHQQQQGYPYQQQQQQFQQQPHFPPQPPQQQQFMMGGGAGAGGYPQFQQQQQPAAAQAPNPFSSLASFPAAQATPNYQQQQYQQQQYQQQQQQQQQQQPFGGFPGGFR
jgi:hypothetical protein